MHATAGLSLRCSVLCFMEAGVSGSPITSCRKTSSHSVVPAACRICIDVLIHPFLPLNSQSAHCTACPPFLTLCSGAIIMADNGYYLVKITTVSTEELVPKHGMDGRSSEGVSHHLPRFFGFRQFVSAPLVIRISTRGYVTQPRRYMCAPEHAAKAA